MRKIDWKEEIDYFPILNLFVGFLFGIYITFYSKTNAFIVFILFVVITLIVIWFFDIINEVEV